MNIGFSNICTAAQDKAVGSRIFTDQHGAFLHHLAQAIAAFPFPPSGQAKINVPEGTHTASCGVAHRRDVPFEGYHIVEYREGPSLFADRQHAAKTERLQVVVYTQKAYAADPDCTPQEVERCKDYDYIVVAVLASAGPEPPLSAYRFVHNLAGGNNEFKPENGYTLAKALAKAIDQAKEIVAYGRDWITVADRV
jgi:hypothetical protein